MSTTATDVKTPDTPISEQTPTNYKDLSESIANKYKAVPDTSATENDGKNEVPSDERFFSGVDDAIQFENTVIKPKEDYWENNDKIREQYIAEANGDEEVAEQAFTDRWLEAIDMEFADEKDKVEKVQMTAAWGARFDDKSWFEENEFNATITHQHETLSGRMRLGNMWTGATRSIRQAQTGGIGYVNDKGELIELTDDEDFMDSFWGIGSDIMYNDNHISEDGRYIIGFEYVPAGPYTRGPGHLKALYQGERAMGEIVSRYDLSDTWLSSNEMKRGGLADIPMSIARSGIGLLTNTIVSSTEVMRSIATMWDAKGESDFMKATQSFNTVAKQFKLSKTDEDMESIMTWSNGLDLLGDVVGQIALAAATGGTSIALMKGMGFGARGLRLAQAAEALKKVGKGKEALVLLKRAERINRNMGYIAKANTMYVYGALAGDGIKEEALKAGYSERSASTLFLTYMLAVGAIGQMSNLMPDQFSARLLKDAGKTAIKQAKVLTPGGEFAASKGTWNLAKRLVKNVDDLYSGLAKNMANNPNLKGYATAGFEEMFEEDLELGVEIALKHLWESTATITGQDPNKKGFTTIHDPEFWAEFPAELLMSTVAGFGGGMIGRALPFTGGKLPDDAYPLKGSDEQALSRIAYEAARGTKMGRDAEAAFFKEAKRQYDSGEMGSLKYLTKRDETGRFQKAKGDDPNEMTIGKTNYAIMMQEYHMMKTQMQAVKSENYDDFMTTNPTIAKSITDGTYVIGKYRKIQERTNELLGQTNPVVIEAVTKSPEKKSRFAFLRRKKKPAAETKAAEAKTKEEEIDETKAKEVAEAAADEDTAEAIVKDTEVEVTDRRDDVKEETAEEREAEKKAENESENEDVENTAEALNIAESSAQELARLDKERVDIELGLTVEEDFMVSYIQERKELAVLFDGPEDIKQYGPTFFKKLLASDSKRLEEELTQWKEVKKQLKDVSKHVEKSKTLEELLDFSSLNSDPDGKVMMGKDVLDNLTKKVNELLDKKLTPELIQAAKLQIIEKFDLFDIRPLKEYKADPGEREHKSKVLTRLSIALAKKMKASLQPGENADKRHRLKLFIAENMDDIVKVVQSNYISSIKTTKGLLEKEFDVTGNDISYYFEQAVDKGALNDVEGFNGLLSGTTAIAIGRTMNTEAQKLVPLIDKDSIIYEDKNVGKSIDTWRDIVANRINQTIPVKPDKNIETFLLREFDTGDPNQITTTDGNLFTLEYMRPERKEDGTTEWKKIKQKDRRKILDPRTDKLLEAFTQVVPISDEVAVYHDLERARSLKKQIQVRKALLEMFSGKHDSDGVSLIAQLASLREYNAKIYTMSDLYGPISESDYTVYSKFHTDYLFDPLEYVRLGIKAENDKINGTSTLIGDEKKRFTKMDQRINYMANLAKQAEGALEEVNELIKMAELVTDEAKMEEEYKGGAKDFISDTFKLSTTFLSKRLPKDTPQELKDKFLENLNKLQEFDPTKKHNDEELAAAYKTALEFGTLLYEMPDWIKVKIYESFPSQNSIARDGAELVAFMSVDHREFHSRVKAIDLGDPPTIAQDRVAFMAYAAILSKTYIGKDKAGNPLEVPSITSRFKRYTNLVFIDGRQGTGKTTMAMGMAVKAAQSYLTSKGESAGLHYDPKAGNKVLLASNNETQLEGLIEQAGPTKANLRIKQAGENGEGMVLAELATILDPTKIDEADKFLEDVSIIVYDELTHVQADDNAEGGESDLSKMLDTIRAVNARRASREAKGEFLPQITVVGLGDGKQGAWKQGMPLAKEDKANIDYTKLGAARNIAVKLEFFNVYSTIPLTYPFRTHVSAVGAAAKKALNVYEQFINERITYADGKSEMPPIVTTIVSAFGKLRNDGADPKFGGAKFSYAEGDLYTEEWLAHVKSQLDKEPKDFTIVLVHDDFKYGRKTIPTSVKTLMDLYPKRFKLESIYTVQGSEFDYVMAVLPDGFLHPNPQSQEDAYTYKLLSMIIGRARYYSHVIVPSTIGITSNSQTLHKIDTEITDKFAEKWGAYKRDHLYSDIQENTDIAEEEKEGEEKSKDEEPDTEPAEDDPDEKVDAKVKKVAPLKDKSLSAEMLKDMKDSEKEWAVHPDDTVSAEEKDAEVDKIVENYDLDTNKTVEELIDNLDKMSEDPDLDYDQRDKATKAREALVRSVTGNHAVEDDMDYDENINMFVEVMTGINENEGKSEYVERLSDEAHMMAKALDKAGYGMAYTFISKNNKTMSPYGSNHVKGLYLHDILRSDITRMEESIIPYHMRRAAGLSGDEDAKDDYTYELITYEYKITSNSLDPEYKRKDKRGRTQNADQMVTGTAIIATYTGGGKGKEASFYLAKLPDGNKEIEKGGKMNKFITARGLELKAAVTEFENSFKKEKTPLAKYNAAQNFRFKEFNSSGKHYTANIQNTRGESVTADPEHTMRKKLPTKRIADGHGTLGSVYVTTDITSAVQNGRIFGPALPGAIVTASDAIGNIMVDELGWGRSEVDALRIAGPGEKIAMSNDFKQSLDTLSDYGRLDRQNLALLKLDLVGHSADPKKDVSITRYDKGGKTYYVMLTKGLVDTTTPLVFDEASNTWEAFFGFDEKGNILRDKGLEETEYYNESVKAMRDAMNKLETDVKSLKASSKYMSIEDMQKLLANTLNYDMADIKAATTYGRKFQLASEHTLEVPYKTMGDVSVTIAQFKTLQAKQYEHIGADSFQLSRPLVFTQGHLKGRAFMLYSFRGKEEVNLAEMSGATGIRAVMGRIGDMSDDFFDETKVLDLIKKREGVGVVMLDSPGYTFTELLEKLPQRNNKIGTAKFNKSSVSVKSSTSKRLQSMIMEIGWAMSAPPKQGGMIPDNSPIKFTNNKRLKKYISRLNDKSNTEYQRVLDPVKLQDFINRLMDQRSNGLTVVSKEVLAKDDKDRTAKERELVNKREKEMVAAMEFINVINSAIQDTNLGMFELSRSKGMPKKDKSVSGGKLMSKIQTRTAKDGREIPKLFRGDDSIISFYPKEMSVQEDGSFIIARDRRGFDLAAFLRIMSKEVIVDKAVPPNTYYMEGDEILLTAKLFDQVLSDVILPGTLQKGVFATPAYEKDEGHDQPWAPLQDYSNLDNELRTTAKGLSVPGLTFKIDNMVKAIEEIETKVGDKSIAKKTLKDTISEAAVIAANKVKATRKIKTSYKKGDVITTSMIDKSHVEIIEDITATLETPVVKLLAYTSDGITHTGTIHIAGRLDGAPFTQTMEVTLKPPDTGVSANPLAIIEDAEISFNKQIDDAVLKASSLTKAEKDAIVEAAKKVKDDKGNSVNLSTLFSTYRGLFKLKSSDIDLERLWRGEYDFSIDLMTNDEKVKAISLNKKLPIIMSASMYAEFKKEADELSAALGLTNPNAKATFDNLYKPIMQKLLPEIIKMKNIGHLNKLIERVDKHKLPIEKSKEINTYVNQAHAWGIDLETEEYGHIVHAYLSASTSERAILEPAIEAILLSPADPAFKDNSYVLIKEIMIAYSGTDHAIDAKELLAVYNKLKNLHPKEFNRFVVKYPIPSVKPPGPNAPKTANEYIEDIDDVIANPEITQKEKEIALASIESTKDANKILSDADKAKIGEHIKTIRQMLNPDNNGMILLKAHIANMDPAQAIKGGALEVQENIMKSIDSRMSKFDGYTLHLENLRGVNYKPGTPEFTTLYKFRSQMIRDLYKSDSGFKSDDVDTFIDLLDDIANC